MRSSLSPLSWTRLQRMVCVTGHPRDKFAIENIHGYVKRKKKPPLTFNLVNSWVFRYQGKRTNQVSLFDTNMKPKKKLLFFGFLSRCWENDRCWYIWRNSRFNFLLSRFKRGENYREMLKQFRKDISQTKYVWHVIEQCRDAAELSNGI